MVMIFFSDNENNREIHCDGWLDGGGGSHIRKDKVKEEILKVSSYRK